MSLFTVITGDDWKRSLSGARIRTATRPERIRAYAAAYSRLTLQQGRSVADRQTHNLEAVGSTPAPATTLQSDSQSPTPSLLRSSESYADAKDGMAALALTPLPGGHTPGVLVEAGSGRGAETCPDRLTA